MATVTSSRWGCTLVVEESPHYLSIKMNTTSYNFSSSDAYSASGGSLICVILGLCFLVGAPGNLLVIWTILRHVRPRSHTVLLILNLAAADLLVLITIPIWIYSFAASWVFGEAMCKAIVYMIYSSMYSSVFLISSLSVERFVAVLYPFALQDWRRKGVMTKVLVAIWILAFMFGTPVILTHTVGGANGTQYCTFQEFSSDSQEMVCLVLETLVGFVIPFSVLFICYTCVGRQIRQLSFKTKQKSAVLIVSVVIAFVVCWFPHHVLNMIRLASLLQDHPEELEEFVHSAVFIFGALAFISSSVNPVLYAFAARRFRSGMRESRLTKLFQEITTHTSGARGPATLSSGRSNTCNLALECKTSASV